MTTWAFIGSGNIGSTVARLALEAGHDVVLSNRRGPHTLEPLVAALGTRARAATAQEAAGAGDVVVVTIPLGHYRDAPADRLAGRLVIDTMNYYPQRDGSIPQLDTGAITSSELFQSFLPDSQVVKSFNNIFFRHLAALARPTGSPQRTALPIAGDDPAARASVAGLLDQIGYDIVDLGPLSESWRVQPGEPAYGTPYAADADDWMAGARPASAQVVAAAVAAARRPG